jgi:hypothetical protein
MKLAEIACWDLAYVGKKCLRNRTANKLLTLSHPSPIRAFDMPTMEMKSESVVGVLDEPYSAKPAQLSSHTELPGYIGCKFFVHCSNLCRLANLYDYSAERG